MAETYVVPALLAHVHLLAPRMRAADRAEVLASDGLRPAQALRRSMRGSDFARTLFIDGQAAAMFGVRSQDGVGVFWALTTETVDRHPIAYWRACKQVLLEVAPRYAALVQCIDARHGQALRWARRLGCEVDQETHPCGPARLPFHLVKRIRK